MQKFKKWVYDAGGPKFVADSLGVSRTIIYRWMWKEKHPCLANQKKIVKLSHGKMKIKDFGGFTL